MRRALDILVARPNDFASVVQRETGKSNVEALMMEVFASCDSLTYWSKRAAKILKDRKVRMHLLGPMKQLRITYRPLGVVGIITPWNGPFVLSLNPTVQALMAGNAVVLKPSEASPMSGKLVEDLFTMAGVPEGVVRTNAMEALQRATGMDANAATRMLWDTYHPYRVWLPFVALGFIAALGIGIYSRWIAKDAKANV